jgi:hypothetical protein
MPGWRAIWLTLGAALSLARPAWSQDAVEFFQGPVLSSNRVIGMGGAFIGIAEGGDAVLLNPAAMAGRYRHTADDFWSWDWGFSSLQMFEQDGLDFDLSGEKAYQSALFLELGIQGKIGRHAFGAHGLLHAYSLRLEDRFFTYSQSVGGLGYAYAARRLPVRLGVFSNLGQLVLSDADAIPLARNVGQGAFLGAIYEPCGASYRVGATLRAPISAPSVANNSAVPGPGLLFIPGEIGVGFSYRTGPNRENLCPSYGRKAPPKPSPAAAPRAPSLLETSANSASQAAQASSLPEDEPSTAPASLPGEDPAPSSLPPKEDAAPNQTHAPKPLAVPNSAAQASHEAPPQIEPPRPRRGVRAKRPRRYTLFAADVVYTGRSPDAEGLQSFFARTQSQNTTRQAAGALPTLGLRLGVESEVLDDRLVLRGGTYYEPSRFAAFSGRVHGTAGFELKLFRLVWDWQLNAVADIAPNYANAGFGIGIWH